ncbi:MAG: hypothetical protein ABIJ86_17260 [Spirochaetota bacterium]
MPNEKDRIEQPIPEGQPDGAEAEGKKEKLVPESAIQKRIDQLTARAKSAEEKASKAEQLEKEVAELRGMFTGMQASREQPPEISDRELLGIVFSPEHDEQQKILAYEEVRKREATRRETEERKRRDDESKRAMVINRTVDEVSVEYPDIKNPVSDLHRYVQDKIRTHPELQNNPDLLNVVCASFYGKSAKDALPELHGKLTTKERELKMEQMKNQPEVGSRSGAPARASEIEAEHIAVVNKFVSAFSSNQTNPGAVAAYQGAVGALKKKGVWDKALFERLKFQAQNRR